MDLSGQGAGTACRGADGDGELSGHAGVPVHLSLADAPKLGDNAGGFVQIADSANFRVSTTIAAGLVTIRPGAMRTMHWHPNADEWQYYMKGAGRMTVFNAGPSANTANFHPGDIGYVRRGSATTSRTRGTPTW